MRPLNIIDYMILFFGTINLVRMAILLIGADVYSIKSHFKKKKYHSHYYKPKVSIIIPAHNEVTTILRTIKSVLSSTYNRGNQLEIIVVDDGSTDDTYLITSLFKHSNKIGNVTVIRQENKGKAAALNNAIKNHTTGELVMCLDADSLLHPTSIENAVQYFKDPKVKGLSANVKILKSKTLLNAVQRFEYIICYQMKRAQTQFNMEYIIGGIGSMFRRSILEKVNFYDTNTVTEDIDLTMKIIQLGNKENKLVFAHDVITYTESCLTLSALIKQRFRWKWGRCQTFLKNISLFFNPDKKYTKQLTFAYLPYALYADLAFFFEPLLVGYIFFITLYYQDLFTLLSAVAILSLYTAVNILAEDTMFLKERCIMVAFTPIMYFFFFTLSLAEYIALIKTIVKIHTLQKSIDKEISRWKHVERLGKRII